MSMTDCVTKIEHSFLIILRCVAITLDEGLLRKKYLKSDRGVIVVIRVLKS